MIGQLVSESRG